MCVCLGRGHSGVEALTPTVLVIGDGPWVRRGPLTMDFASVEEETGQGAHIFTTQQAPLALLPFWSLFLSSLWSGSCVSWGQIPEPQDTREQRLSSVSCRTSKETVPGFGAYLAPAVLCGSRQRAQS